MTPEQLQILIKEIDSSADMKMLDDKQVAIELNKGTEKIDAKIISSDDIYSALNMVEMETAVESQWSWVKLIASKGSISPEKSLPNIRILIEKTYKDKPETLAALLSLTYQLASRAEVLGLPVVEYWDVGQARGL